MTTLNTIIEEEAKVFVGTWLPNGDEHKQEQMVSDFTTAIQRAYEAGEREADAKWKREVEVVKKLLEVATCPDSSCNQEGVCIDGYGEPYQCQWCYERHDILSKIRS